MKKTTKKVGIMAASCMLACSSAVMTAQAASVPNTAVYSAQHGIMPLWDYVIMIAANMDISSSGWTDVFVDIGCDRNSVNKITALIEVQRLENRSWKTVKSWTETSNSSTLAVDKATAVYKGYNYRLKVTVSAYYSSTLLEKVTETFDYGFYN